MNTSEAQARRDSGMGLAIDKADRDRPGWSEDALQAVRTFASTHIGQHFLAETVRSWCESSHAVESPKNERAWGAVMRRAAKEGCVRKVGYAPSQSSNLSPKTLWESVPALASATPSPI